MKQTKVKKNLGKVKKTVNTKVSKKTVKKKVKKVKITEKLNKKDLIFLGIIVATIAVIILSVVIIRNVYLNNKYKKYTLKMEVYGFSNLYDNQEIKRADKINSEEAAKMVIGVVLNKTDKNYAYDTMWNLEANYYKGNEGWTRLAKYYDIYTVNTEKQKEVSKVEIAIMLTQAIEQLLNKNIEITDEVSKKWIKIYGEENAEYINKAISIGILKNKKSDLKEDASINKGELEKMLITVAEDFGTVYFKNQNSIIYDKTDSANIVTDKNKLPENSEIYPYVIDSIEKEIYEITTENMTSSISEYPNKVYSIFKDNYASTDFNITRYFNEILNIDYTKIDEKQFANNLAEYFVYAIDVDDGQYRKQIEEYVKYVKTNKITLKGSATPLLPIVYSNGMYHFLRTKIEFEVVTSDTQENLLLFDENTTYTGKTIIIYVDVPVSPTLTSKTLRIVNGVSLMDYIVKNDGNVEVK